LLSTIIPIHAEKDGMLDTETIVAKVLLDIRAVHLSDRKPFTFTSGTLSPVYVDCRKLISFPKERGLVMALARALVDCGDMHRFRFDVIAGGETAGIPYAAWLAHELGLPMIYVRKAPKGFGRLAQIEGQLDEQASVLLVEDLLFDAQSKINFCTAIRKAGARVENTLVVFDYANARSRSALHQEGIALHALTNWPVLLQMAEETGYFSAEQSRAIRAFLDDPGAWSRQNISSLDELE
jgi:orotate phosphoribosyltransferase